MSKSEERNLNVTIKNEPDDKDSVVISLSGLMKKMKKYLLTWIIAVVVCSVSILGIFTVKTVRSKPPITALISFNYSGIEKGVDPSGKTFDVNMVKNPQIIASALADNELDLEKLEKVRQGITFEGIIPPDVIDKITTYQSVYSSSANGNLQAAQAMLDVTYYPTQFKVTFNYGASGVSRADSVKLLNSILNEYRNYFYQQYGYNKTLGVSVSSVDYSTYDYPEALDLFDSTLSTLSTYVRSLSNSDVNNFHSNQTGFTFNDINQAIGTIRTIDLDKISSYVNVNNITKDKAGSISYYKFRIDSLTRDKDSLTERLENISQTIENYQKDQVLVISGVDGSNTQLSQGSEEYDRLVERKDALSTELAQTKQRIKYYTQRKEGLEKSTSGSTAMNEKVDADLAALSKKLEKLVEDTRITSEEYYETVEFANAYSVLVPAVNSTGNTVSDILHNSLMPLIIVIALLFVIYIAVAFVTAIKDENSKAPAKAEAANAAGGNDDDDDDDDDDNVTEDNSKDDDGKKKTKSVKNKW